MTTARRPARRNEALSEWELREGAWAIVRNARELSASGHDRAVRWARGYLGPEDGPRHAPHDPEADAA